jgi:predicted regulator of Ras-like GTPase activity (Roadblock/LC7/MglB family)
MIHNQTICMDSDPDVANFEGSLAFTSVLSLLQYLNTHRATGELYMYDYPASRSAMVYFDKGEITHASTIGLSGIDGLARILGWIEGSFRFTLDNHTPVRTIDVPIRVAILQAKRFLEFEMATYDNTSQESILQNSEFQDSKFLGRFSSIRGYLASIIATSDGHAIATHGVSNLGEPQLIAQIPLALLESTTMTADSAGFGQVNYGMLDCEHSSVVVRWLGENHDHFIAVFIDDSDKFPVIKHRIEDILPAILSYVRQCCS